MKECELQSKIISESDLLTKYYRNPCCECTDNGAQFCQTDSVPQDDPILKGLKNVLLIGTAGMAAPILLSNEIRYSPAWVSYSNSKYNKGVNIELRHNWKKSGWEYGVLFVEKRTVVHTTFVHDLLYSLFPGNFRLFAGGAFRFDKRLEYFIGFVGGMSYKVGRFRFDVRTAKSEFHQVQAGVSFIYQKKPFWKK